MSAAIAAAEGLHKGRKLPISASWQTSSLFRWLTCNQLFSPPFVRSADILCQTMSPVSYMYWRIRGFLQPRSALKNVRNVERRLTKIRPAGGVAPTRCARMFTIAERNAKGGWKHTNGYALSTRISTRHIHTCSQWWLTYTQIHMYRLNWKQHKVACGQDPTVVQKLEHMFRNTFDTAKETNPDLLSDEQRFKKVRFSILFPSSLFLFAARAWDLRVFDIFEKNAPLAEENKK